MKYMVFYVEGCSPKVKYYTSKKLAQQFVLKFLGRYSDSTDDNWVDAIIHGEVISHDKNWFGIERKGKK